MTIFFSNPAVALAQTTDIPAIKDLLNKTYRGDASRQGWTTEADLIAGETRADEQMIGEVLGKEG
ncbi:MAG TPA: hypothetical protein PKD93_13845, partial [Ferruginibacter sp.]|nr:hypothetical protein [Ferruginibacter sp.]